MEIAVTHPLAPLNLKKEAAPFLWVSLFWLGISATFSHGLSFWLFGLWLLCVADLGAMVFMFRAVFGLMNDGGEKRAAYVLNASVWGAIKLACLGLFGFALFRGQNIPSRELLLSLGTMVVVPLVGGFWWSQKVLSEN